MSLKAWLAPLLLGSIALSPASGQDKPGQKAASAAPDFTKDAYVIERLSSRITAERDGTGMRETVAEVKMLAEAGVKAFAVINFTYNSSNEVVDLDYVRVRKPDGTIVKTPDYNIQDMPGEVTRSAPLYSDVHEKHVAVKGLSVGDTLEYLVRIRVVKPEVPGQFWDEYSFRTNSIVKEERVELNVPADKYVKIVSPKFKPEMKEEGGRRIYTWSQSNLLVKEKDPDEVPRRVPPNPDVQITTFASWEEVGNWYGGLQKEPLTVTPAIQAKAAELTKGLTSDDEKVHAIYNFVSLKYHYIGLDFGIGRYQPHAADDVLDNGYGDCKDKHTLLASLLKAAGIDAWPALIHTSRKLDADVPSPAQFNHVITVVPLKDSTIWLDTTPEVATYRVLMPLLRNKQALVIPTGQPPRLMTTPENPPRPQRQEFVMSGKLSSDGVFTGHVEQTYESDIDVVLRMAFRQTPEAQWKELVQRFSQALNFAGEVSNVKVSPPDDLDKPLQISYDYVRKNFGDWENHHTFSALPPIGIESSKDARVKKPQEPVLLGAIGTITYRTRMELPSGYRIVPPTPLELIEPYLEYRTRTVFEDGVMTVNRTLKIKKTEVPLEDWEEFRKLGEKISDDEFNYIPVESSGKATTASKSAEDKGLTKDPIDIVRTPEKMDSAETDELFRNGETALRAGDFQRAQELFQKVLAANPDYKGAHLKLGIALASRNNMPDALEEFHKEEKLTPEDTRVHQVLALYLQQIGKRDEAAEQWRKLLKYDPENRTASSALAGLLYQQEKYPEAISVLEAAIKFAPDNFSLHMQLGSNYLKTGENEKAIASYRKCVEEKDDPMVLNNVSYELAESKLNLEQAREWAEKAVKELEEQAGSPDASEETGLSVTYQLSLVWDTVGWIYFEQGDYKRAEDYIRAAWLLGEESIVGEHLGEVYEKEGKKELAARAYENALAVSGAPALRGPVAMNNDAANDYRKRADGIIARYQKLTGRKPELSIRRLPNGTWTQTPAEQLRHSRQVKLSNGKAFGIGQFTVTFKPGKVEAVKFESGMEDLKAMQDQLKAAHYPIEFPSDSHAVLLMHVEVSCQSNAPCVGSLINPLPPTR